jgi:hypothetical protein
MLRQAAESIIDMDLFGREQAKEQEDAAYLAGVRKTVKDVLANTLSLQGWGTCGKFYHGGILPVPGEQK